MSDHSDYMRSVSGGSFGKFFKTIRSFGRLVWLQQRFLMSKTEAGHCTSVVYWCVILAPFAGSLTDQIGNRLRLQIVLSAIATACFMLLYVGVGNPWVLVFFIGVC